MSEAPLLQKTRKSRYMHNRHKLLFTSAALLTTTSLGSGPIKLVA